MQFRGAKRLGAALLITALAMLMFVMAAFAVNVHEYRLLSRRSDDLHATIDAAGATLSALKDIETGQRGFLITSDPAYLDPFNKGIQNWTDNLAALTNLAAGDRWVRDQVAQLSRAGNAKIQEMATTVALTQRGRKGEALARVETGFGKQQMDIARRITGDIVRREEAEFRRNEATALATSDQTRWMVETAAAILFLLTLAGTLILNREIARERRLAVRLEHSQKKYRDLAESLEQQVEERTRELQDLNQELQSFSYSVSHDLRAPLRAVDGFSLMLLEDHADRLDPSARELIQRIRRGSSRMGQLINSLLDLSKATRVELRRQPISISDLALQVVEGLRSEHPEREVEAVIEPGLTAEGDPHLIRIVLENLISNAWKFSSRKEAARIEIGKTAGDGAPAFFVRDNGAGFDPAYARKLFIPFQRLHSESEFEGTGIGLATAQRVIRRHGGTIRAESEKDKGATFYFTL